MLQMFVVFVFVTSLLVAYMGIFINASVFSKNMKK
jgi:hypothetical protein